MCLGQLSSHGNDYTLRTNSWLHWLLCKWAKRLEPWPLKILNSSNLSVESSQIGRWTWKHLILWQFFFFFIIFLQLQNPLSVNESFSNSTWLNSYLQGGWSFISWNFILTLFLHVLFSKYNRRMYDFVLFLKHDEFYSIFASCADVAKRKWNVSVFFTRLCTFQMYIGAHIYNANEPCFSNFLETRQVSQKYVKDSAINRQT